MITMIQNNGGFCFGGGAQGIGASHVDEWRHIVGAVRQQIAVVDGVALRTTLPFSSFSDCWRWRQNS